MNLRGIEFGPILGASGLMGFFGEGHRLHKYYRFIPGYNLEGLTFVAKTTTLKTREGNIKSKCVILKFRNGVALNAVGLSGPGSHALFADGRWQERVDPFFISFMSVAENAQLRKNEFKAFKKLFSLYLEKGFSANIGWQINFSCPNVGLDPSALIAEVKEFLRLASFLDVPIMPKFNILTPPQAIKEALQNSVCDAICVSNTIPWGKLPEQINWRNLFGSDVSPLAHFGGGGLSGWPLLSLVCKWVRDARKCGINIPINAGGGILCPDDVDRLKDAGASSVFLGSGMLLRPHRVKKIIERAYKLYT